MEFAVQVQIIENRQSRKYLVLIDFNEFSRDCLMLLGIFGFPFADADCDAFLSPVNPPRPVCAVPSLLTGQASLWSPAPAPHRPHRSIVSLASDAAQPRHSGLTSLILGD